MKIIWYLFIFWGGDRRTLYMNKVVTTLGQHLIRNIHAMFGFIPFIGFLKEDIFMFFP